MAPVVSDKRTESAVHAYPELRRIGHEPGTARTSMRQRLWCRFARLFRG